MSFVTIIAKESFITVMSDGLAIDLITREELNQNYKKFRKISPKQFVAASGNQGIVERIFEIIGENKEELDLYEMAKHLRKELVANIPLNITHCQVVLGGIESGNISVFAFSNNEAQEIGIIKPTGKDISHIIMQSNEVKINPYEEYEKLIKRYNPKTSSAALKVQEELNRIVADNDPTVNKITFKLIIKK